MEATPQTIHFRNFISRATFASQIVRLYLEPWKSYKASKLTMLEKCNIFRLMEGAPGAIPPLLYIFLKLSSSS